jgi:hypothetical protein
VLACEMGVSVSEMMCRDVGVYSSNRC